MLLDRSKRYASLDGKIPRLTLASNWQLLLVGLLLLALFVVIFPRKTLLDEIYARESVDDLTRAYILNLFLAEPGNPDVAIFLAKMGRENMDIPALESMILKLSESGDTRQKNEARFLLGSAYESAYLEAKTQTQKLALKSQLTDLISKAKGDELPTQVSRLFANAAFEIGSPKLGVEFLKRVEDTNSPRLLENYGDQALASGDYVLAAEYFFIVRNGSQDLAESRRLFRKGIAALMASSRYTEAMASADLHIGDLASDPVTLRYLARTALAAGQPNKAAQYARGLVFQTPIAEGTK